MNVTLIAIAASFGTALLLELARWALARRQKKDEAINENSLVLEVKKIDDAAALRRELAEQNEKLLSRIDEVQKEVDKWRSDYFKILPAQNENELLRKEMDVLRRDMQRLEKENTDLHAAIEDLKANKVNK